MREQETAMITSIKKDIRWKEWEEQIREPTPSGLTAKECCRQNNIKNIKTEKQNAIRRKRADLPNEKTLEQFVFGFQKSTSKEKMLRLFDMTWVEQTYNICFLGPPGIGKTHLATAPAVKALDMGYSVVFTTLDKLIKDLKTDLISSKSKRRIKNIYKVSLVIIDEVGFMPLNTQEAN